MIIPYLFNLLFFILPLVFFAKTSEVFEFNKIITIYIFTTVIVGLWVTKMIVNKKVIFRRTILDMPILLFLGSQILSTFLSIDIHTSIFGYYSRFNGGLLSSLSYALLYWAYVSNIDERSNKKNIVVLLILGVLVSVYAILEHFGHSISCLFVTGQFNDECWVQDVRLRVFATVGQPNWLAAYLVAILPLSWVLAFKDFGKDLKRFFKVRNFWIWTLVSFVFFITLIFTKSRSGFLGLGVAAAIFWSGGLLIFLKGRKNLKKFGVAFFLINFVLLLGILMFGTAWTPTLGELVNKQKAASEAPKDTSSSGTALETGGTESGKIRQIVWKGALDVWRHYPIVGSGVETFAYSYYQFRPVEHNLVSEWDFLYNKAHNEFLNFMATTGTIGIATYLFLIGAIIWLFVKVLVRASDKESRLLNAGLLAGFVSILVTDFFGFSVVLTSYLFFLLPAISIADNKWRDLGASKTKFDFKSLNNSQKLLTGLAAAFCLYLLFSIGRYWQADYLYSKGKINYRQSLYSDSVKNLKQAINLSPNEAVFHQELANEYSNFALGLLEQKDATSASQLASYALAQSQEAFNLSPRNIIIRRSQIALLMNLSIFDQTLLTTAADLLNSTIALAPTDARLELTLCKVYFRLGKEDAALEACKKSVELKPDYVDSRIALEGLYKKKGQIDKAKEQLEYVLKYLAPDDTSVKEELQSLTK